MSSGAPSLIRTSQSRVQGVDGANPDLLASKLHNESYIVYSEFLDMDSTGIKESLVTVYLPKSDSYSKYRLSVDTPRLGGYVRSFEKILNESPAVTAELDFESYTCDKDGKGRALLSHYEHLSPNSNHYAIFGSSHAVQILEFSVNWKNYGDERYIEKVNIAAEHLDQSYEIECLESHLASKGWDLSFNNIINSSYSDLWGAKNDSIWSKSKGKNVPIEIPIKEVVSVDEIHPDDKHLLCVLATDISSPCGRPYGVNERLTRKIMIGEIYTTNRCSMSGEVVSAPGWRFFWLCLH